MGLTSGTSSSADRYLPTPHRQRADRLFDLWQLYSGDHESYFLDRGNSRYTFRPMGRASTRKFYAPFDLLSLISRKTADLLFGEAPRISSELAAIRGRLGEIIENSALHATLIELAIDSSWSGEAYVEIVREAGRTVIQHQPVREIFPLGPIGADGQARRYVRYATENVLVDPAGAVINPADIAKATTRTARLLLTTTYSAGRIEHACSEIGVDGAVVRKRPLTDWPVKTDAGEALPESIETGMDEVSIVRFRNSSAGESDYTPQLVALQDTLSAKNTQLARVVQKHADPKMYFATATADSNGNVSHEDDAIFGDSPEAMPKYITWEAQLPAAVEDRKFALLAMATVAEMPLSVLGVKDDAAAESAAKMRLMAINAIAKVQRKSAYHVQSLRIALARALRADGMAARPGDISIQTRDGIPDDENERAQQIATLRAARVMSLRRALAMQQLDEAEIEAELKELNEETQASLPSVFMNDNDFGADAPANGEGDSPETTAAQ